MNLSLAFLSFGQHMHGLAMVQEPFRLNGMMHFSGMLAYREGSAATEAARVCLSVIGRMEQLGWTATRTQARYRAIHMTADVAEQRRLHRHLQIHSTRLLPHHLHFLDQSKDRVRLITARHARNQEKGISCLSEKVSRSNSAKRCVLAMQSATTCHLFFQRLHILSVQLGRSVVFFAFQTTVGIGG